MKLSQKIASGFDWQSIAQIYSPILMKKLVSGSSLDSIRLVAKHSPIGHNLNKLPVGEVLDCLYDLLKAHYRSEYVYKNTLAQKISIARHQTYKNTLLTEFRVNKSRADLVIINGTSSAYEIKTEFDDLDRLTGQVFDYKKIFDMIYVVTHSKGLSNVIDHADQTVGVIELTKSSGLKTHRPAISNIANVEPAAIFDSLRQSEYLEILHRKFGFTPSINRFNWYQECKEMFEKLSPHEAHAEMLKALKDRTIGMEPLKFISQLPKSLGAIGLTANFTKLQKSKILKRLSESL